MTTSPDNPLLTDGARFIVAALRQAGYVAYWAGGCVRDLLIERPPKDYDIATSASPDEILRLFPHTVPIGKAFGVIGVIHQDCFYEVATFRKDGDYSDGRRPAGVAFTDAEQDARRRDFTINALFYDPIEERVLDYVGGEADLRRKAIRAVGDADIRFKEDHLRMLRAIRFAFTLGFELHEETRQAIERNAPRLSRISPERIRDELLRILTESRRPGDALQALLTIGILDVILPEIAALHGCEQPPEFHPEGDVFQHTCLMLNHLPPHPAPELALAVLFHDVGKPPTARMGPGANGVLRIRFDGHDKVGAEMTELILKRLRCANVLVRTVTACVRNHMRFMHVQEMRRAKLRVMVAAPWFPTELELHRLDCLASHGDLGNYAFMRRFLEEWKSEPALPRPWIRGEDILALGVPAGPSVGRLLKVAYARQLEGHHADRELLLEWVTHYVRDGANTDRAMESDRQ